MKDKPALFSTPMVRSILEYKKTTTRRIIKPQPNKIRKSPFSKSGYEDEHGRELKLPYLPGQTIWVRETFTEVLVNGKTVIQYRADEQDHTGDTWKPSIFLKRVDARLFLTCEDIYPEALQAISYEDINAEGVYCESNYDTPLVEKFTNLWDSLNKERGYSWQSNPYIWVIKFSIKEIKETGNEQYRKSN